MVIPGIADYLGDSSDDVPPLITARRRPCPGFFLLRWAALLGENSSVLREENERT